MRKTIKFGKFAIDSKRKVNAVEVEVEFYEDKLERPVFKCMASVWNSKHTDITMGGQCLDSLVPYLKEDRKFMTIWGLWKRNHLNDMDACANDAQRKAVKEYRKDKPYDYDKVCEYLKGKGLYEVEVEGKKCKYGHDWYYREIPEADLIKIQALFNDEI